MNRLTAGEAAPSFELPDQDGNTVTLAGLSGKKGSGVLLP